MNPSCDPKNSSIFLGSSAVGRRAEVPMGTMLVSSGRGEGAVGGIVRFVESDGVVGRVTTSEAVWAEAVMLDMRLISKKTRQKAE